MASTERGLTHGPGRVTPLPVDADRGWSLLFACWLVVTAGTLGSLFFSEIMELPPCSLCWWQRLCMFPLVFVVGAGLFPFDPKVVRYALPLAVLGVAISIYHTLLQQGIVPESVAPCTQGASCSDAQLALFGFLSIPMLASLGFATAAALLVLVHRSSPE